MTDNLPVSVSDDSRLPAPIFHGSNRAEMEVYRERRTELMQAIDIRKQKAGNLAEDVAEELLNAELPDGLLGLIKAALSLGYTVSQKRNRIPKYRNAVISLLRKVLDPTLEFRMTANDIRDVIQDRVGLQRNAISQEHIRKMYVWVEEALKEGPLREQLIELDLVEYVNHQLKQVQYSRLQWKVDHT